MLAFRSVQQGNHCAREEFLYELKAGPAGGRLRRPSSRRQRHGGHRGAGLTLPSGYAEQSPGAGSTHRGHATSRNSRQETSTAEHLGVPDQQNYL
jgi:hypothetical protein